jgi:glycosyltransferase involved in cell wall biosynthesis
MGRLINRLVKKLRSIEDLPIFATKLREVPRAATLAALARTKGVSHLHAHFGTEPTTVAMLASQLSGLPYSFAAHAYDIYDQSRVNPVLLKEKIHLAQFVVTCTEYNRRTLRELAGRAAARKIIRIYHGVPVTRFRSNQSVQRRRHLILAVGRLVEKKGFPYLLHALKILREKGRSFQCLIVGEGEERENLAGQINALGLRDLVGLPGARPQEQVLNLMKQATLFVLPCVVSDSGNRDGLPNALVEALAVGLPAISTTLSGIPELIEHGVNGLLVPPGDSVSLALAIEQMLMDPDLRERLARNGIKKVRECFDLRKNVKMFRNHLARSISVTPFSET